MKYVLFFLKQGKLYIETRDNFTKIYLSDVPSLKSSYIYKLSFPVYTNQNKLFLDKDMTVEFDYKQYLQYPHKFKN